MHSGVKRMADSNEQRGKNRNAVLPERFLAQLRHDVALRKIDHGIQLLEEHRDFVEHCGPQQKDSAIFLGLLAECVDMGFAKPELVKELLGRFPSTSLRTLPVPDFVHLQMAAGFVDLSEQEDVKAIRHFEIVLVIAAEVHDQDLITIANFWIGRCYSRQGRYRDALGYVVKAREAAARSRHFETVAAIQTVEGWLLYQEGKVTEGIKALRESEDGLLETDDYVARGSLNSVYGKISQSTGNYDEALRRFEVAMQEYRKRDEQHRNVATCLVNIAFVKRLIALELSEKIDCEASRTRMNHEKNPSGAFDLQQVRQRVRELHQEAFQNLKMAGEIYDQHRDCTGSGHVEIGYGQIHLDEGALDLASSKAQSAYRVGDDKNDTVLKARALILQSAIEYARVEEQIVDSTTPRQFSRLASEYAYESMELAKATQNVPLLAESYVALGFALLSEGDVEAARDCHNQAANLLKVGTRDYISRQLQVLKNKLASVGAIEPMLREWSRGVLGNRTFQEVTEEFAAIVIPRVWQRENCKISRVAAILAISPKKVRRILRSQGHLRGLDWPLQGRESDDAVADHRLACEVEESGSAQLLSEGNHEAHKTQKAHVGRLDRGLLIGVLGVGGSAILRPEVYRASNAPRMHVEPTRRSMSSRVGGSSQPAEMTKDDRITKAERRWPEKETKTRGPR